MLDISSVKDTIFWLSIFKLSSPIAFLFVNMFLNNIFYDQYISTLSSNVEMSNQEWDLLKLVFAVFAPIILPVG